MQIKNNKTNEVINLTLIEIKRQFNCDSFADKYEQNDFDNLTDYLTAMVEYEEYCSSDGICSVWKVLEA